jgi:hypothetical protein
MLFQNNMCELLLLLYGKVNFNDQILDIKVFGFNKFGIFKYFNFGFFLCTFLIHCFVVIMIK